MGTTINKIDTVLRLWYVNWPSYTLNDKQERNRSQRDFCYLLTMLIGDKDLAFQRYD